MVRKYSFKSGASFSFINEMVALKAQKMTKFEIHCLKLLDSLLLFTWKLTLFASPKNTVSTYVFQSVFFNAQNVLCPLLSFHTCFFMHINTPSIPEKIWVKNVRAIVVCGFLMKSLKNHILKIWKKSWVPFRSYLLNSKANPAQFEWKWAGLAVLAGNS